MAIDLDDLEAKVRATGDLKGYRRLVEEAFKRAPAEVAAAHLEKAGGELRKMIGIVKAMSISGEPIFLTVSGDLWHLMADAFGDDPEAYLQFIEEVKEDIAFDAEMARAEMDRQVLLPPRDFQGIRQWIESFEDRLQWYQRMAKRLVGYLYIKDGEASTLLKLRKMDIVSIEAKLEKEIGAGVALGDEYRHLRNSISHGTFNIEEGKRQIQFIDINPRKETKWRKTYAYEDLAAMHHYFLLWFMAASLALASENVMIWGAISRIEDSRVGKVNSKRYWESLRDLDTLP